MIETAEGAIYITSSGGYLIFEINGEFDIINSLFLKKLIKEEYDSKIKLIVNLTKATYISSTGVGVLLELKRIVKKDIFIVFPSSNYAVQSVIDALCLTHVIPSFESIYDCISQKNPKK